MTGSWPRASATMTQCPVSLPSTGEQATLGCRAGLQLPAPAHQGTPSHNLGILVLSPASALPPHSQPQSLLGRERGPGRQRDRQTGLSPA